MVKTVARNRDRDIYLENGQLAMCDGVEACAQIIEAAIRTQKGELVLYKNTGIPYFETIFDKPQYAYQWDHAVKKRILSFPFVNKIISFDYDIDHVNHLLKYTASIETTEGVVKISSELK